MRPAAAFAREYPLKSPNEAEIAARIDAAGRLLSTTPARLERA